MPTKHVVKSYGAPAYYHAYKRASGERKLFGDDQDRNYFLSLLRKYLLELPGNQSAHDQNVKKYDVNVAAYCLMGSHYHLLLYQSQDPDAMTGYMRSVGTSYSMYYNKKYRSKGHVFQSTYRASHITNEAYLAHITRYLHLNPRLWRSNHWSTYKEYVHERRTAWVHPELVSSQTPQQYRAFVADYADKDRRSVHTEIQEYIAL